MTPIEILNASIQGLPAPRIPVFCNLLDQGARELGLSQQAYYAKGEHVAEGQLKMRARYGYDNVWSLFYVGKEAELLGCNKILFSDSGTPNVSNSQFKTIACIMFNFCNLHGSLWPVPFIPQRNRHPLQRAH
ncbi:uroporphyrinogen decarboxylase family protein [Methylicorpusculum sp.]|uniref:uroporphyrinogen decarboxylase family protein n=1 Tax=Methylicorpusculum sp. TaxID=2713644 RepID=UPI002724BED0|nr:uroporphyrinogen decarboxylase family protein [Methylicorpusculum sp.]MDO8843933.1 uroporphyrinogen decarboxylase family protein [Methylicorpusculum sp.]